MLTLSSWPSDWCLPVLDDLEFDDLVEVLEVAGQLPDIEFDADGNPIPRIIVEV